MDKLTEKIMRHERISNGFIYAMLISLFVCIMGLILDLAFLRHPSSLPLMKKLDEISWYIMDNLIIWIPGTIFIVYFACVAIFAFIGINIGPKNKID